MDTDQLILLHERAQDHPFHLVTLSLHSAEQRISRVLRDLCRSHGLSAPQWRALWVIRNMFDELTSLTNVGRLMIDAGSDTGRVMMGLRNMGLVVSRRDPEDDRRTILRLTSKGEELYLSIDRETDRVVSRLFTSFSDSDRSALLSLLNAILGDGRDEEIDAYAEMRVRTRTAQLRTVEMLERAHNATPPMRIVFALRVACTYLNELLEMACAPYGLSRQMWAILQLLSTAGAEGLPTSSITRGILPGSPDTSRRLQILEREGYIRRWKDGRDRRRVIVSLTSKGVELFERIAPTIAQALLIPSDRIPPERLDRLCSLLLRIDTRPFNESMQFSESMQSDSPPTKKGAGGTAR